MSSSADGQHLERPGVGRGLRDVFASRFLLKLVVRKELKVRYRGSVLGLLWSYVKPGVQFLVFYLALGVFLGLEKSPRNPDGLQNYAIYLFSGVILVNFFTEALGNAARSIVGNGGLIKKIYLPRELFPVSSVWVSAIHFLPQLIILLGACLLVGWHPTVIQLIVAVVAFLMIAVLATGLGLFFGAVNVYFRDSENFVDMLLMVATWISPVLYPITTVQEKLQGSWLGEVIFALYQANPMTVAVEIFHVAFWTQTNGARPIALDNLFTLWLPVGLVVSIVVLFIGQRTFRKLEGHFAQEL